MTSMNCFLMKSIRPMVLVSSLRARDQGASNNTPGAPADHLPASPLSGPLFSPSSAVVDLPMSASESLNLAVVGAGPVGLALALHAARSLPAARITVFDARPADHDVAADPRTLALSLGSVQLLRRLGAWDAAQAQPITEVHVSQAPPSFGLPIAKPEVRIRAQDEAVPMLGAVLQYGAVVAPLQRAWMLECERAPQRLQARFGTVVRAIKPLPGGAEVDSGVAEGVDLAVIAEGGVFGEQPRKTLTAGYGQTAWVGRVTLAGGAPGVAYERFTRHGPAALLPLKAAADGALQAALVWCVPSDDDPVRELNDTQRLAVLNTIFPDIAGRLVAITPLKSFPLGLNAERTLVQGRCVRIGNAAQTLHPVAGQGLNLGLRDAFELVEALRRASSVDAALRRLEWRRAPDRWSMIAATDFLARSFTWQAPGLAAARGLTLAALQAATPVKSLLARQMMFGRR
jgi:2-octaprenyl-6-methoxyphenol hydroxylase